MFLAPTNDDEANIMSSLLAKRLGARKVMCIINNPAYVDLVQGGEIDIAISPQLATIGTLLTHVRRGDIVSAHSLRRGVEAIEVIAHGDPRSSKVVGRAIEQIALPPGTTIGAVIRDDQVLIAHDDTRIESGDHVILFLVDKKHIRDVERLFRRSDLLLKHAAFTRTARLMVGRFVFSIRKTAAPFRRVFHHPLRLRQIAPDGLRFPFYGQLLYPPE